MTIVRSQLTIVFDPPFYKAIFEHSWDNLYEVGQIILGPSEPKMPLIEQLVNERWPTVHFFQKVEENGAYEHQHINPKRLQRLARKSVPDTSSTKAQQTLQQQYQQRKSIRKRMTAIETRAVKQVKYHQKQVKRQLKHRGH